MGETAAAIDLVGLTKRFGEKTAVDGLNLTVAAGEIFAFLGPNGAGKTTTIKMMSGLLRPSEGHARICGHDVHSEPTKAKEAMSYVPDEPYLYDKLTGREFLRLVGDLYALPRGRTDGRIEELQETLEFADYIDDLTESYSHGMKQRVVLSAALLHDPPVLVVDEPMVGLDPRSSRRVKNLFLRMAHERGAAVFMSTHTLAVAEEMADRVGIIHRGRAIACGRVAELKAMGRAGGGLEELFLELTEPDGEQPAIGR